MRLLKYFKELFNFKNWIWIRQSNTISIAEFSVNSIRYQCAISLINDTYNVWDLSFYMIDKLSVVTTKTSDHDNASKVLSNVKSITEEFLSQNSTNILLWKSIDFERHGLYKIFGEHLSKLYHLRTGFKFYGDESHTVYWVSKWSSDKVNRIIDNQPNLFDKFKF